MLGAARTAFSARAWAPTGPVNARRTGTDQALNIIGFRGFNDANYSTTRAAFGPGSADLEANNKVLYYDNYNSSTTGGGWPTGTGDFCIEGWIWVPSGHNRALTGDMISFNVSSGTGGLGIRFGAGYNTGGFNHMQIWARGQADLDTCDFVWPTETWCHWAVQRKSSVISFWADGNQLTRYNGPSGTAATRSFASGTAQLTIGSYDNGGSTDETIRSWVDEICVSNSWRYDDSESTYTVPTSAFVTDEYTDLLIKFDYNLSTATLPDPHWDDVVMMISAVSGTVADRSQENNTITVVQSPGPAASTTQLNYNSHSIFQGASRRWRVADNTDLNCDGEFTLEFWIWGATQTSTNSCPMAPYTLQGANQMIIVNGTASERLAAEFTESYNKFFISPGDSVDSTWHHAAITRDSSNVIRFFYDGSLQGTTRTSSSQINFYNWMFGGFTNGAGDNVFEGYFDDIRLTKDVCRYTASFTPPTTSLPNN